MSKKLKLLNEDNIKNIDDCIYKVQNNFPRLCTNHHRNGSKRLYHYTSFSKLFDILDGDSFWASRSRFSNDSTEEKIFGDQWALKEQYYGDNYILCFCEKDDILSQWRGYCPQGGASIGFEFPIGFSTYTVLHNDYDKTSLVTGSNFEIYKNRPLPVLYCKAPNSFISGIEPDDLLMLLKSPEFKHVNISDIVPYLKNSFFKEELEYRLVFNNSNNELEKCINFRKLDDGSMVPYVIIKYGDFVERDRHLSITYDENEINSIFDNCIKNSLTEPIVIPYGRDQADVYAILSKKIKEYKKSLFKEEKMYVEKKLWLKRPIKVICEGHLPIVSITVSPSPRQEYMKEVIERFCQSKYWLQNVEVKCSQIPYIAPKIK